MLTFYYVVPKIDGFLFPVLENPKIEYVNNTSGYKSIQTTEIQGSLDKIRDCDLLSFEFFVGIFPDAYSNVRTDDLQPVTEIIRPRTNVHFGPYRIYAPIEILQISSFVIVTHNCYDGFLWNTETFIRVDSLLNQFEAEKGFETLGIGTKQ